MSRTRYARTPGLPRIPKGPFILLRSALDRMEPVNAEFGITREVLLKRFNGVSVHRATGGEQHLLVASDGDGSR